MNPRPHVSAAIVQLRLWVWLAAAAVVISGATELLAFGFVHYTDARFSLLEGPAPERVPAEVVRATAAREAARPVADPDAPKAPEVNRVPNATDRALHLAVQIASTAGVIAAVWLMLLTMLGVVVGAGASVPGIERAVTAAAWSIVLAMLCLPLKDWLPSMPWAGVFGSYAAMTTASEAARAGSGAAMVLAVYVGLPIVAVVGAVCIGVWFRTGVERGMLLTTVAQIDEALERELSVVRSRGVAAKAPRAMSALTRTIGEPAGIPPTEQRLAAGAENMGSVPTDAAEAAGGRWRIGAPVPGSPEKRPI